MFLTIHHRKGGVGKTTTAQHIAAAAAKAGIPTLLIDCDGQANCSAAFGLNNASSGIADVIRSSMRLEEPQWNLVTKKALNNLDIIPSTSESFKVQDEIAMYDGLRASLLLSVKSHLNKYRLIVCDTAPSAGWLVCNALLAADRIIAPVACETFAVDGLSGLNDSLVELGRKNTPNHSPLRLSALVPTMYHASRSAHKQLLLLMREQFDHLVTRTVIRTDANIESAQNNNQTVFDFAPKSRAAADYIDLMQELFNE